MSRRRGLRDHTGASDILCGSCGIITGRDAFVCDQCLDSLVENLRSLQPTSSDRPATGADIIWPADRCPWPRPMAPEESLWEALRSRMIGEAAIDYRRRAVGHGTGGSEETGLVLHENASDTAADLTRLLKSFVLACQHHRVESQAPEGWQPSPPSPAGRSAERLVPDMAAWLQWRVDAMAFRPEFADAPAQLAALIDSILRIVDAPAVRIQLSECPTPGCAGTLVTKRGAPNARCAVCDYTTAAPPLIEQKIDEIRDRWFTAAEIARISTCLALNEDRDRVRLRINQWAHRGLIPERGLSVAHDDTTAPEQRRQGATTYRFGDVYDRLTATQTTHDTQERSA